MKARTGFAAAVFGGIVALAQGCAGLPQVGDKAPGAPALGGKCPDMRSADAVASFEWAKEFKVDASVAGKLKGGLAAALELDAIAAGLDADLRTACGGLAADLGAQGTWKSGAEACDTAVDAMAKARGRLGASARITLTVRPPRCSASIDAMADCAARCDASVTPGKAEFRCEGGEFSGGCEGECSGSCSASAAARCEGTCQGSCSGSFSGSCDGTCNGKCDGKTSQGARCAGQCDGSCEGSASGRCQGGCSGDCEFKAAARCDGTCTGRCSVEFKEPTCSGEIVPPKVSAECKARCDARVSARASCTPARVALRVVAAVDTRAVAEYQAAIEKNLPAVLKIAVGMKDRLGSLSASVKGVVKGAQGAVKGAASGAGGAQLMACVAEPFKSAIDAAASIRASVDVSVKVQASASASGSASAGGG
jgi:hypothetical protein